MGQDLICRDKLVPMSVPVDACWTLALFSSAGISTVAKVVPSRAAMRTERGDF